MTERDEVERIAQGLSRAERTFVERFNPGSGWYSAPKDGWRRSQRGKALSKRGLFSRRFEKANGLYWYQWTDLGRAVAAALARTDEQEGKDG